MVQIKKAETEAEFNEVARFWAYVRNYNVRRRFGKSVEEMFGLTHEAKTLEEECRRILDDSLRQEGETWYCRDKGGIIRYACVFEKRYQTHSVHRFRGKLDRKHQEEGHYGRGGECYPYRQALLQAVLLNLLSRDITLIEMEQIPEDQLPLDLRSTEGFIRRRSQYFDTVINKQRTIVEVDVKRLLESRATNGVIQKALKEAERL